MTTHADASSTRYTFAITVAVFVALMLGGLIVGTAVWPKANATPTEPAIEITVLMSNVDVPRLPATEIADLFWDEPMRSRAAGFVCRQMRLKVSFKV